MNTNTSTSKKLAQHTTIHQALQLHKQQTARNIQPPCSPMTARPQTRQRQAPQLAQPQQQQHQHPKQEQATHQAANATSQAGLGILRPGARAYTAIISARGPRDGSQFTSRAQASQVKCLFVQGFLLQTGSVDPMLFGSGL